MRQKLIPVVSISSYSRALGWRSRAIFFRNQRELKTGRLDFPIVKRDGRKVVINNEKNNVF